MLKLNDFPNLTEKLIKSNKKGLGMSKATCLINIKMNFYLDKQIWKIYHNDNCTIQKEWMNKSRKWRQKWRIKIKINMVVKMNMC